MEANWENREQKFDAPIPNDSTITFVPDSAGNVANPTGLNTLQTSALYGDYLEVELIFEFGKYQRIFSVIIRGELSNRKNNT